MTALPYTIPPGTKLCRCLGCNKHIYWIKTERGASMPVDVDGMPHWATCPEADRFRGKEDSGQQIFEFDGGTE